jgi:hypothetical protein
MHRGSPDSATKRSSSRQLPGDNILDRTWAGWEGASVLSSRNLSALPAPGELERRCQALALLDAILSPESRWRYFTFDAAFASGERVARMDSATGDSWLIWFSPQGVVVRGFDHESPVSPWGREPIEPWPGLFDGLPEKLGHGPRLEVDGVDSVTFCLWWDADDPGWRAGVVAQPDAEYADPDGSEGCWPSWTGQPSTRPTPRRSMSASSLRMQSSRSTGTSR